MRILNLLMFLAILPVVFAGVSGTAPIPPPPNWYITSPATTVCRGEINYLPITVGDASGYTGFQMQNTQLSVAGQKGIYYVANGTVVVGTINVSHSDNVMLPVFIDANVSSLLTLGINLNYYFGNSQYSDSEIKNITFAAETCSLPLELKVTPQVLTAGVIQNVTVNFTNTGATTLNTISARFNIPGTDGSWLSQQPIQLSTLPPMSSIELNESVYISRNASQNMPVNTTVVFYNGTHLNQIAESVQLLSSGIINITPSTFAVSPQLPSPSSIFSISFILTDTGTAGATALTVTPVPVNGFTVYGSKSVFVGDIGVDSQTPVTVSLETSNSLKSGTYEVPIKVNYLNNLRSNITVWANTTVMIGQSAFNATSPQHFRSGEGGSGISFFEIILLIAVVALGYLLYKEKQKAHK